MSNTANEWNIIGPSVKFVFFVIVKFVSVCMHYNV